VVAEAVLPAPAPQLTSIDVVLETLLEATLALNFSYCAVDPSRCSTAANRVLDGNLHTKHGVIS
jgi:hypothetical protein